jgi:3-oxoacyl-[acyl-carrier-protein] synthase II
MKRAQSSLGPITQFDTSGYRTTIGGEITSDLSEAIGANVRGLSRAAQFSVAAAQEALRHAGLLDDVDRLAASGICLGSGLGGLYFSEASMSALHRAGPRGVSPMLVPFVDPNCIVSQVAMRWGIRGPQFTVSTACSSSAHALGQALDMIRAGRCDVVVAGGSEATVSPLIFAGFDRLRAMSACNDSPSSACKPFSSDRDGFVMAEGAAVLILESEDHMKARGATPLAEFKGYGASGGAYNAVTPRPEGDDLVDAMRKALRDAGLGAEQIDLINPHGTGTQLNDEAEELALLKIFGERASQIPVTPTKQLTGHLLGAAAALESVHAVLSIAKSFVTPVAYHNGGGALRILKGQGEARPIRNVLKNSFGFGNNNATLVFGACQ